MDAELSVVIPAYNEEGNIAPLYREIKDVLEGLHRPYEILFVDDGSKDRTFLELKTLCQQDPLVKVFRFKKNFGQSAALQAGFDHATGALVVTLDADLQNDPQDMPTLIEKLEKDELDVVCGWRYNRHDTLAKKIFSKLANRLRKTLTGETIHDSGCTLRVYRVKCVKDLELSGELHRYIPAILQWKGYSVGKLPVNHRDRRSGTTKYTWTRLVKGFLDLLVVTFWQKYSARPMHIFGGFGLTLLFLGVITECYLVFERMFYNVGLIDRPLFLVGLILLVIGIQFIALGVIADVLLKIFYTQTKKKNNCIELKIP